MLNRGLDKVELLRIVEAVANEKSIDKEIVLEAMETAIQKAALTKFGIDNNIRVVIDRINGEIKIQKVLDIVEEVEDSSKQIDLNDAKSIDKKNKDLKVGDQILEDLPQIDFGRIAAQSAKQVISLRVKEAEKNRQYEDFVDKQGQILSGIIKRLEYGNVIVDLGKAEAIIKKDELIPREILKTGDRVKAYCYEVKKELKGQQIFLSRAHPQFLAKLFFQEVPEIYEGVIEIKVGKSSVHFIISIFSPCNSLTILCTRLPLIPTQAPTGSIELSLEKTQIFALLPGSLATALISITPS